MTFKVGVLDYGIGNIGAVSNMLEHIKVESMKVRAEKDFKGISALILPGVGSFDAAVETLERKNLIQPIKHYAITEKKPILGICLGMHLLANSSEEGIKPGLGLIPGKVLSLRKHLKSHNAVPNMGWCYLSTDNEGQSIEASRYYFAHSYFYQCANQSHELFRTTLYDFGFTVGVIKNNVVGVQFHPEKSHRYGIEFFKNFSAWARRYNETGESNSFTSTTE